MIRRPGHRYRTVLFSMLLQTPLLYFIFTRSLHRSANCDIACSIIMAVHIILIIVAYVLIMAVFALKIIRYAKTQCHGELSMYIRNKNFVEKKPTSRNALKYIKY